MEIALYNFAFYALHYVGIAIGALCGYKSRKLSVLVGILWLPVPGLASFALALLPYFQNQWGLNFMDVIYCAVPGVISLVRTAISFAIGIGIAVLLKKLSNMNKRIAVLQKQLEATKAQQENTTSLAPNPHASDTQIHKGGVS